MSKQQGEEPQPSFLGKLGILVGVGTGTVSALACIHVADHAGKPGAYGEYCQNLIVGYTGGRASVLEKHDRLDLATERERAMIEAVRAENQRMEIEEATEAGAVTT